MENINDLDIEQLKNSPEFQDNLRLLEKEMREQESIAKGYQLLDAKLVIEAPEDEVNDIFTFIVNKAFDNLADKLSREEKFDLSNPEEWATVRAIYEHGVQRYSENDTKGAKEIFLILYYTIPNEDLKDAMMVHACAVMSGMDFDKFIKDLADMEDINPNDPNAFFITNFVQPTDILLQMYAKEVKEGKELLAKMEEASSKEK